MGSKPWKRGRWIPGVLNQQQMWELCKEGYIRNITAKSSEDLDASSLDLHIADEAFRLDASIKPSRINGKCFGQLLDEYGKRLPPKRDGKYDLDKGHIHIFKLKESLAGLVRSGEIHGLATARSTIGRVDVLARLIVDGMDRYDSFDSSSLKTGDMYVEVIPVTFNVRVMPGFCLNQLRLFCGRPEESVISAPGFGKYVGIKQTANDPAMLSVNLEKTQVGDSKASALCAKGNNGRIDLWTRLRKGKYDPMPYWDRKLASRKRLLIERNKFYILRSKERLAVPDGVAIYCQATDETIGEMRIHYAGFVHPWFGCFNPEREVRNGAPLIFEVRGHLTNVNLRDGEKLARLTFYRMSKPAKEKHSVYDKQELKLSSLFKDWP